MSQGKLKKELSLLDLTFLGVGSIIGSGWLYAALNAAAFAGPLAWIPWFLGAFAIILLGLTYAELGAAMPRAGGFVRYPEYSHGSIVGYLIGFASFLAYSSVVAVEVLAVRQYAAFWWPELNTPDGGPSFLGYVVQTVFLVLFFLLNYWSVNMFGKSNTYITWFKFLVPSIIIIVLLFHFDPSNLSVASADPGGMKGVFKAVAGAGIVFSFLGFRQAIDFAGEAKNPQRNIPRAIVYAVLIGLGIYLLLQIAFLGAIPHNMLISMGGWDGVAASGQFAQPYADIAAIIGFTWLVNLVLIDAVVSPAGTGNIYFGGAARVIFAWAKTGSFFSRFGKVDPKTGLPRASLWLTFILAFLWTVPSQFQVWSGLIGTVVLAFVLTYMMGPISMGAFRKTAADMERPYVLKGASVISPLAFIAATLISYWSGWGAIKLIISITLLSIVFYIFGAAKKNSSNLKEDLQSAYWLFAYYIGLMVLSYLGSYGGTKIIPNPLDLVFVSVFALVIYYWAINSGLKEPRITDDEESQDTEQAVS